MTNANYQQIKMYIKITDQTILSIRIPLKRVNKRYIKNHSTASFGGGGRIIVKPNMTVLSKANWKPPAETVWIIVVIYCKNVY